MSTCFQRTTLVPRAFYARGFDTACEHVCHTSERQQPRSLSHSFVYSRLKMYVLCCRDELVESHYVDNVVLTAALITCTVPILWERGTGAKWVLAERMHHGLGIIESGPTWQAARTQLLQGGARVCTAAEQQLLRGHPDMDPSSPDFVVASLDAAIEWLLELGEPTAAEELCQLQRLREQLHAPDGAPGHLRASAGTGSRGEGFTSSAALSEADGGVGGCSGEGLQHGCVLTTPDAAADCHVVH